MAGQITGDLANFIAQQADIKALEDDLEFVREHVDDLNKGANLKIDEDDLDRNEDCIVYSEVKPGKSRGSEAVTADEVKKLNMKVGIIGGGVAGLYTAMLLEWLHIDCEIVEAADRIGGRINTYPFDKERVKPDHYSKEQDKADDKDYEPKDFKPSREHGNYYDVGAMRFPDIPIMERTFKLFDQLGMRKKDRKNAEPGDLIPYILSDKNNPRFYNETFNTIDTLKEAKEKYKTGDMTVKDLIGISTGYAAKHNIPEDIILRGHEEILDALFKDWMKRFKENRTKTFDDMMALDRRGVTMRMALMDYLGNEYCGHTLTNTQRYNIIQWCETMGAATNHFDEAFVSVLLHSLEFDWPADAADTLGGSYGVPPDRWWCVYGGTENLIPRMKNHIRKVNEDFCPIRTGHRVVRIEEIEVPGAGEGQDKYQMKMHLRVKNKTELQEKTFSHIICTTTTPCLQVMDLRDAGLTYAQREAIRCLRYDNSVKVGIRFKKRWWTECNPPITGAGVGYTDRPTRVTVYPSYTIDKKPEEAPVLLACYNWAQDAARIGHLIEGSDPTNQQAVLDVVIADLAAMHFKDKDIARQKEAELHDLVDKYHVHDWYHYEHTGGAFGMFGPGQFGSMFPYLRQSAAHGHLFFAGEITSIYHGWVVASLNSARRAVEDLLLSRASNLQGRDEEKQQLVLTMRETLQAKWDKVDEVESDEQTRRWQMVVSGFKKDVEKGAQMRTIRSDS